MIGRLLCKLGIHKYKFWRVDNNTVKTYYETDICIRCGKHKNEVK